MILDTAFVLDLLEGDERAVAKAEELESDAVTMKLPAMTVLELYIGIGTGVADEEEETQIRRIIDSLPFVPMDMSISRRAGRRLAESGSTRRKGDAAIAATAAKENEPVLTRNVEDFEQFSVDVEMY